MVKVSRKHQSLNSLVIVDIVLVRITENTNFSFTLHKSISVIFREAVRFNPFATTIVTSQLARHLTHFDSATLKLRDNRCLLW